jgi:beta-glucosidase
MPWAKNVNAIVEAWFPGVRGGEALANLLFGKTNFSGKLPISYPASEADLPHAKVFAPAGGGPTGAPSLVASATNQTSFDAVYDEGLKVGYKWFDAEKRTPAYPFGFGLSYTSFAYSALKATGGASLQVTFVVKNTGTRAGRETAQVYLALPASAGEPPKRLVGWEKVDLKPGESKTVTLNIDPLYLSVFDTATDRWRVVPGEYKVMAGTSSAALPLSATVGLQ